MSKEKPALYYAMITAWDAGLGFKVIAVTSEKGRQVYGRDLAGNSTNRQTDDVIYRFPTEEAARGAPERARAARAAYAERIKEARMVLDAFIKEERAAVYAAARGVVE